ncbi:MAG: hypothetical protein AAF585_10990 [Verrucomicrobiota bacterium]
MKRGLKFRWTWVWAALCLVFPLGVFGQDDNPNTDGGVSEDRLRQAREILNQRLRGGELPENIERDENGNPIVDVEVQEERVYEVPQLPEQIEDPGKVPPYVKLIIFGSIGGLIVAALLTVLVIFIRRQMKKAPPPIALPPPLVEALGRLDSLTASAHQKEAVAITREVSDSLKRYTDRKFGVDFQKRTTEELQMRAGSWSPQLPASLAAAIVPFLDRCDMIKFMGSSDIDMEKKQIIDEARRLIEEADDHADEVQQDDAASNTSPAAAAA